MQLPDFEIALIHAEQNARSCPPHVWIGPFSWDMWVMDWCDMDGVFVEVTPPGKPPMRFKRPAQSWNLYAPGVSYRQADSEIHGPRELMWIFIRFNRPWQPMDGRPLVVVSDREERLGPHLRAMYSLQQSGDPWSDVTIHGHATAVLGEVLAAAHRGCAGTPDDPWPVQSPESRASSQLLQRVDRVVARRWSEPPTVAELAHSLGMSVSSLAHRFREETGMSVMERVRWLRIREARRLLSRPGASVKQVAAQLGFSSPFHFSKCFRDITALTPASFIRQRNREAAALAQASRSGVESASESEGEGEAEIEEAPRRRRAP
jgi:AraC-like DNA-binding protein